MNTTALWPDGEYVRGEVITPDDSYRELSSLWNAYELGRRMGSGEELTHDMDDLQDPDAYFFLEPYAGYMNLIKISWSKELPRGQSARGPFNLVGFVVPSRWWWRDSEASIARIEFGCKHDFEIHSQRRCYREGTCAKCGQWYAHDSGD